MPEGRGKGKLEEMMKRLLMDLGIRHADFIVRIFPLQEYTPTGIDGVQFLFAANKNQEPGEIAKVASGGEISRGYAGVEVCIICNQTPACYCI